MALKISFKPKFFLFAFFFLIMAGSVATAGYFYWQYRKLNNVQAIQQKEVDDTVKALSKLIDLPKDETPTLATIVDKEKLKDQPFFSKAENGDKVLFYTKLGRAILFRPSISKIVDVTLIKTTDATGSAQVKPNVAGVSTEKVSVALYNGTTQSGLTNQVESQLTGAIDTIAIASKGNANQSNYSETRVVDISGNNASLAQRIANQLNGTVGSLPGEEEAPQADILVIIGGNLP